MNLETLGKATDLQRQIDSLGWQIEAIEKAENAYLDAAPRSFDVPGHMIQAIKDGLTVDLKEKLRIAKEEFDKL